jgi:Flp pilus assembly protein TadG
LPSSSSSKALLQRGNAVVEFALCFGVLWACFAGACGLGYAALIYQRLHNTLLAGARYAATAPLDVAGTQFKTNVSNMVVYGAPAGGTIPFVPGLSTSQVLVTWATDANGIPKTVTIAIQGYRLDGLFQVMTLSGKPQFSVAYMGVVKT